MTRHGRGAWSLAWCALLLLPVCASAQSGKLPDNKGFTTIAQIMAANCARCHAWAGSYEGIASPSRIVATVPGQSLLFRKIRDDSMPPAGRKLSAEEKELVRAWLAAGASSADTPIKEDTGLPEPCPCGLPQK